MDDLIRRRAVVNTVFSMLCRWDTEDPDDLKNMLLLAFQELPAVDAVPVIRCKDCKYWREYKYAKETRRYIPFCGFNAIYTKADDFCSKGERKTND